MNSLMICLNAIAPIFLIIAVGCLARRAGVIRAEDIPRMNAVAFKIFMPVMCFYNVRNSELSSAVRPRLLVFTAAGILLVFFVSLLYATLRVPDRKRRAVVIQGLYRSNYVIIGIPFAAGLAGESELGVAAVLSALVAPMFNVLAVVVLAGYDGAANRKKLAWNILTNPLIVGSLTGLLFLAADIRFPAPVETAVRDMARVASPLLLFLLGAFFHFGDAKEHLRELVIATAGRLVVVPGVMLTLAAALGFRGIEFVTLLAVFGSSTAVASFTMAEQMGGDAKLAGNIVVMTSACASFTLFAWSLLFRQLGFY